MTTLGRRNSLSWQIECYLKRKKKPSLGELMRLLLRALKGSPGERDLKNLRRLCRICEIPVVKDPDLGTLPTINDLKLAVEAKQEFEKGPIARWLEELLEELRQQEAKKGPILKLLDEILAQPTYEQLLGREKKVLAKPPGLVVKDKQ